MLGPRASTPWKLSSRGMPLLLENEKRDSRARRTAYCTRSKRGAHTWIGGRSPLTHGGGEGGGGEGGGGGGEGGGGEGARVAGGWRRRGWGWGWRRRWRWRRR